MEHTKIKKIMETGILMLCLFLFILNSNCPLQKMFGIPCPGCNMSTALYYLVYGNVKVALFYHPLVVFLLVLIMVELILYIKYRHFYSRISKYLFYGFIFLLIVVYVYRMFTVFPNIPMVYVEDNMLVKLKTLFF